MQKARGAAAVAPQGTQVPLSPCYLQVLGQVLLQVQCCGLKGSSRSLSGAFVVRTNTGLQPSPTKPTLTGTGSYCSLVPGGVWALPLSWSGRELDKPEQVSAD